MPSGGEHLRGRPPKLTPEVEAGICAAIRKGCYARVAAARLGVSAFTMYLWNQRGKREADERDERSMRGEPCDEPPSIYERFHIALEAAQADARYGAETRVFATMPLHWLTKGYARRDRRDSGALVRQVADVVMERVRAEGHAFVTAGDRPSEPSYWERYSAEEREEHRRAFDLLDPADAYDREAMREHASTCRICREDAAEWRQEHGGKEGAAARNTKSPRLPFPVRRGPF
jgi:hypothetical protein